MWPPFFDETFVKMKTKVIKKHIDRQNTISPKWPGKINLIYFCNKFISNCYLFNTIPVSVRMNKVDSFVDV